MIYKINSVARILFVGLFVASPVSAAKQPLHLQPSSKWLVNYADDSCRLGRVFGTGNDEVTLVMDRFGVTDSFSMTLSGKLMKTGPTFRGLNFQFGPVEEYQEQNFFPGVWGDGKPAIVLGRSVRIAPYSDMEKELDEGSKEYDVPFLGEERERAVTYLALGKPLSRSVILETGSMGEPFAALRRCTDELLTHWGIDVERHKNLTRKVTPVDSPQKWFHTGDYPMAMLQRGQSGIVHVRLSIDDQGLVSDCHIQQSTRPVEFDKAVCRGLQKRSKFLPALDAEQKPINSYWFTRVVFEIG